MTLWDWRENELIHIYFGDGKGKTSTAVGMAVRAAGNGKSVVFAQFMKSGSSGEIEGLKNFGNITVLCSEKDFGFFKNMSSDSLEEARQVFGGILEKSAKAAEEGGFLILDEITHAINYGLVEEEKLKNILDMKHFEIVLTGRNPKEFMLEKADYISEIKKIKHPYDRGICARKGVEF
ncbi:MAG: cob(I)yrinic acid a,c-diamide adenosyltransferase [Firmicutes bacterium]|nr:cob(I)yrinic acid a,c-diamide adenosyltransferase [Bacillota bacterium]